MHQNSRRVSMLSEPQWLKINKTCSRAARLNAAIVCSTRGLIRWTQLKENGYSVSGAIDGEDQVSESSEVLKSLQPPLMLECVLRKATCTEAIQTNVCKILCFPTVPRTTTCHCQWHVEIKETLEYNYRPHLWLITVVTLKNDLCI